MSDTFELNGLKYDRDLPTLQRVVSSGGVDELTRLEEEFNLEVTHARDSARGFRQKRDQVQALDSILAKARQHPKLQNPEGRRLLSQLEAERARVASFMGYLVAGYEERAIEREQFLKIVQEELDVGPMTLTGRDLMKIPDLLLRGLGGKIDALETRSGVFGDALIRQPQRLKEDGVFEGGPFSQAYQNRTGLSGLEAFMSGDLFGGALDASLSGGGLIAGTSEALFKDALAATGLTEGGNLDRFAEGISGDSARGVAQTTAIQTGQVVGFTAGLFLPATPVGATTGTLRGAGELLRITSRLFGGAEVAQRTSRAVELGLTGTRLVRQADKINKSVSAWASSMVARSRLGSSIGGRLALTGGGKRLAGGAAGVLYGYLDSDSEEWVGKAGDALKYGLVGLAGVGAVQYTRTFIGLEAKASKALLDQARKIGTTDFPKIAQDLVAAGNQNPVLRMLADSGAPQGQVLDALARERVATTIEEREWEVVSGVLSRMVEEGQFPQLTKQRVPGEPKALRKRILKALQSDPEIRALAPPTKKGRPGRLSDEALIKIIHANNEALGRFLDPSGRFAPDKQAFEALGRLKERARKLNAEKHAARLEAEWQAEIGRIRQEQTDELEALLTDGTPEREQFQAMFGEEALVPPRASTPPSFARGDQVSVNVSYGLEPDVPGTVEFVGAIDGGYHYKVRLDDGRTLMTTGDYLDLGTRKRVLKPSQFPRRPSGPAAKTEAERTIVDVGGGSVPPRTQDIPPGSGGMRPKPVFRLGDMVEIQEAEELGRVVGITREGNDLVYRVQLDNGQIVRGPETSLALRPTDENLLNDVVDAPNLLDIPGPDLRGPRRQVNLPGGKKVDILRRSGEPPAGTFDPERLAGREAAEDAAESVSGASTAQRAETPPAKEPSLAQVEEFGEIEMELSEALYQEEASRAARKPAKALSHAQDVRELRKRLQAFLDTNDPGVVRALMRDFEITDARLTELLGENLDEIKRADVVGVRTISEAAPKKAPQLPPEPTPVTPELEAARKAAAERLSAYEDRLTVVSNRLAALGGAEAPPALRREYEGLLEKIFNLRSGADDAAEQAVGETVKASLVGRKGSDNVVEEMVLRDDGTVERVVSDDLVAPAAQSAKMSVRAKQKQDLAALGFGPHTAPTLGQLLGGVGKSEQLQGINLNTLRREIVENGYRPDTPEFVDRLAQLRRHARERQANRRMVVEAFPEFGELSDETLGKIARGEIDTLRNVPEIDPRRIDLGAFVDFLDKRTGKKIPLRDIWTTFNPRAQMPKEVYEAMLKQRAGVALGLGALGFTLYAEANDVGKVEGVQEAGILSGFKSIADDLLGLFFRARMVNKALPEHAMQNLERVLVELQKLSTNHDFVARGLEIPQAELETLRTIGRKMQVQDQVIREAAMEAAKATGLQNYDPTLMGGLSNIRLNWFGRLSGPYAKAWHEGVRRADLLWTSVGQPILGTTRAVLKNFGDPARVRMFRAIEEGAVQKLADPQERAVAEFLEKTFAQLLELQNIKRLQLGQDPIRARDHYITHLFDATAADAWKRSYDPRAKKVFNAFDRRRKGADDFIEDAAKAFDIYTSTVLRDVFFSPSYTQLEAMRKILPEDTYKALKKGLDSGAGRYKAPIDKLLYDQAVGKPVSKVAELIGFSKEEAAAGGKFAAERAKRATAYLQTYIYWAGLAGNVKVAAINLTDVLRVAADVGMPNTARALRDLTGGGIAQNVPGGLAGGLAGFELGKHFDDEDGEESYTRRLALTIGGIFAGSVAGRHIGKRLGNQAFREATEAKIKQVIPDIDVGRVVLDDELEASESVLSSVLHGPLGFGMFNEVEKFSRRVAALSGWYDATAKNLVGDARIQYARDVVERTTFWYLPSGRPGFFTGAGQAGRPFLAFKSFPVRSMDFFRTQADRIARLKAAGQHEEAAKLAARASYGVLSMVGLMVGMGVLGVDVDDDVGLTPYGMARNLQRDLERGKSPASIGAEFVGGGPLGRLGSDLIETSFDAPGAKTVGEAFTDFASPAPLRNFRRYGPANFLGLGNRPERVAMRYSPQVFLSQQGSMTVPATEDARVAKFFGFQSKEETDVQTTAQQIRLHTSRDARRKAKLLRDLRVILATDADPEDINEVVDTLLSEGHYPNGDAVVKALRNSLALRQRDPVERALRQVPKHQRAAVRKRFEADR